MHSCFKKTRILCVILLGLVPAATTAQALDRLRPSNPQLTSDDLSTVTQIMADYVDQDKLAGISTLVEHQGDIVYFESAGYADRERQTPFTMDTIYRLHSMTKPLTAVAAMILYEEGKIDLDDPVSKYIPAFADLKVHVSGRGEAMITEELERPMTVRDVLTHQSGLSYSFFGPSPIHDLYIAAGMKDYGERKPRYTLADMMDRLSEIPLVFQPGKRWQYSYSTDVMSRVVEVASGQNFDGFIRSRITGPLEMEDTDFMVPADKARRLAASYGPAKGGGLELIDDPATSDYLQPAIMTGGGTGLAGSMRDYLTFSRMLLAGGTWEGTQILSRRSVEAITSDQIYRDQGSRFISGLGFGLAMQVVLDDGAAGQIAGSKSEFSWGGSSNTNFWINPEQELIIIVMAQFRPVRIHNFANEIRQTVYDRLTD